MPAPNMTSQATRAGLLAGNTLWSLAGFAVPTLVALVSTPLYLSYLGDRTFGLWTLCIAILAFTGILNLSLGEATTALVAGARGGGDAAVPPGLALTRIVTSASLVFTVLALLATLIMVVLAEPIAVHLLKLRGDEAELAVRALRLVSIGVLPTVLFTVASGVFEGLNRFRASQLLVMGRAVTALIVGWLALAIGSGFIGLVVATVAVTWATAIVGLVSVARELQPVKWDQLDFLPTSRRLLGFGMYSSVTSAGTLAIGQLDKLVVGSVLGLEAVASYALAQALASKVHQVAIAAGRVLMPHFASGDRNDDARQFPTAWRASLLFSAGVVTLAAAVGPVFLPAWVGAARAEAASGIFAWLLAAYGLHALNVVPYYYLTGRSRPDVVAAATLVGGGSMLVLLLILTPHWHLHGAGLAALCYPLGCLVLAWKAAELANGGASPGPVLRGMLPGLPSLLGVHALIGLAGIATGAVALRLGVGAWVGTVLSLGVAGAGIVVGHRAFAGRDAPYFGASEALFARLLRRPRPGSAARGQT